MKAVILAGGFGTRISEESAVRPKPMIEIGGRPILWHVMKIYSAHGVNEFVVCLGYKGYMLKEYFANYYLHETDVTFDIGKNTMEVHRRRAEPWRVTLVDTGAETMTGGRLRRVAAYLGREMFCMTYGDGVADINIRRLLDFHTAHGLLATLTAVRPPGRFGALDLDDAKVAAFREKHRGLFPDWHNAPVPSFGPDDARLLIVGLAPGMRGANRTGRPFSGDYAGDLLYTTLLKYGLAEGTYDADPADGLLLKGVRISNAVRCVPPENRPTPLETATCRRFLAAEIAALPKLRAVLALGSIAHSSVLAAIREKQVKFPFSHGALHRLGTGLILADSYHCSRLNTNTGRLTEAMFHEVFEAVLAATQRTVVE